MTIPYLTFPTSATWETDSAVTFSVRSWDPTLGIVDELVRRYNDPTKALQRMETLFYLYQSCDFWIRKLNTNTNNRGEARINITGVGLPVATKVTGNTNRGDAMQALKVITGRELATRTGKLSGDLAMVWLETIYGTASHGNQGPSSDAVQVGKIRGQGEVAIFLDQAYMQRRYKLRFRDGVAWRWNPVDDTNTIFDTTDRRESESGKDELTHFVMDTRGRIYAGFDTRAFWFKHSSFLGGANTHAAGRIKIVKGRVTEVVNDSGHYGPSVQQMRNLLQRLRLYGCAVGGINVQRIYPTPAAAFTGDQILASGTANWPDGH